MVTLSTQTTKNGISLTIDGANAGIIEAVTAELNGIRWQFKSPCGVYKGMKRISLRAAEYDALAHWEDVYAGK